MVSQADLDSQAAQMLAAIHETIQAAPGRPAGMWAVGEKLGWDRNRTEDVVTGLMSEGLLEIKTLSGGVVLTEAGLAQAGAVGPRKSGPPDLAQVLKNLEQALTGLDLPQPARRDFEADLAALRTQLARSRPLPPVVEAALQAVRQTLESASPRPADLLAEIDAFLKSL